MTFAARISAVCLATLALAGCGSDSDFSQMGGLLWQNVSQIGGEGPPIARARAAAVPYASIGVRYGSNPEVMLILATDSGGDSEWLAGTQVSIVLRDGRIIRTVGFPHDLSGFQGPISDAGAVSSSGRYHYLYDFAAKHIFGAIVECTQHDVGLEHIVLVGGEHDTRHVAEDCYAPQLDWRFRNDFWRDSATGTTWKSIQNIYPDTDPITVSVLRPRE
jgi:hypothetical protein